MAGFIAQNQNALSWQQAAAQVVSVLGNAGDTPQESIAKLLIQDIIRDLNSSREWSWLQQVTNATVTSSGLITLPTRTKKVYAVVVDKKTLEYVNERDWLREVDLQQAIGATICYSGYNTSITNKIEVRDHPSVDKPYILYYLSLISIDTASDPIDVPESIMAYILAKAKSDYVATIDSSSPKLQFYTALAEQRYRRIVRDDEDSQPDQDLAFKPGYLWPNQVSGNSVLWGNE